MSVAEEYRKLYNKYVCEDLEQEITIYDREKGINIYRPLTHNCRKKCTGKCNHQCHKSLGELMRKNIIFYCYGEDEIVTNFRNGLFSDLEKATKVAYKLRLPKRQPNQDGLPSEVLLDAIIQSLVPDAYKMAVRTIFRQNDNNEIKGYDLSYFTNIHGTITLWLGQAKLGSKQYCKSGILEDLEKKYTDLYMARQIYFLADKPVGLTEEGIQIANLLNRLNMLNACEDDNNRAEQLMQFLKTQNIGICIPCLLAYDKADVYADITKLESKVESEIAWAKGIFEKYFKFAGIEPELIFIIFPIDNIEALRGDEGFYAGLC
ncbi:MAG: DUF1837 domain-containing protein [Lachnospiraceae bacterium]|nr:DUF1837 domain-containing protein [Lachnospiraceae bacterium]